MKASRQHTRQHVVVLTFVVNNATSTKSTVGEARRLIVTASSSDQVRSTNMERDDSITSILAIGCNQPGSQRRHRRAVNMVDAIVTVSGNQVRSGDMER